MSNSIYSPEALVNQEPDWRHIKEQTDLADARDGEISTEGKSQEQRLLDEIRALHPEFMNETYYPSASEDGPRPVIHQVSRSERIGEMRKGINGYYRVIKMMPRPDELEYTSGLIHTENTTDFGRAEHRSAIYNILPAEDDFTDLTEFSEVEHRPHIDDVRPARKTRFLTRAEARDLPPPVYLVDELIEVGADSVIYGDSQSLKTFVALGICCGLATGLPAFRKFAMAGKGVVFYLAAEGKINVAKKRVTAWEIDSGFEPFSIEDVVIGDGAFMTDHRDVEEAIRDIEYHLGDRKGKVPVLFVIDTLSRALNGQKEDDAAVSAMYLNNLKKIKDRIGGTSLTIAHTGKDPSRGLRGSSGYFAGFDTVLFLNTTRDPDTYLHTLDLEVEKQKDGISGKHYYFQSREVEIPDGKSLVLDSVDDDIGKKDLRKTRKMVSDDVWCAINALAPNGSTLTLRQIANKISATAGISVDGVEKNLRLAKERGEEGGHDPYKQFRDGDLYRMPSSLIGAGQTMADQIKELRDDDANRIRRQQIDDQMSSIFPDKPVLN
jgi:hypothetical protein